MANIAKNILETVGHTPLVEISPKLNRGFAHILVKLESLNPGGSIKDRAALSMIEEAEKAGNLTEGGLIIEPTSGNTGIGLALAAAVKGYKLILTMPETMSIERRKLLCQFGAEIVLTPGENGMTGAIAKARELARHNRGVILQQFENEANPDAHYKTTGPEIWEDSSGEIDALVASVGTGGTISGTGRFLREKKKDIKIIAVEPEESNVISGGKPGPHGIQGIGAGFVPKICATSLFSEVIPVSSSSAIRTARDAAKLEGILMGISSGAALNAALQLSLREEYRGKTIVAIMPDTGERYLSTDLFA